MPNVAARLRLSDRIERDRAEPDAETLLDLGKLPGMLRRQGWLLAFWIATLVALGVLVLATTPPRYRAVASVLLIGEPERRADQVGAIGIVTPASLDTAQQLLRSRTLALRVVDALDLHEDSVFLNTPTSLLSRMIGTATGAARGILTLVEPAPEPRSSPVRTDAERDLDRREAAARRLQQDLFLGNRSRSAAIDIGYEGYDAALAAGIANAYTAAYTADRLETSFDATTQTTQFLRQRIDELEADARRAALEAETFRAASGLVESGDRLLTEDTLARFSGELAQAQAELARADALVESYDALLRRGPGALTEGDGARASLPGDVRVAEMGQVLSGLTARRAEVARAFGNDHPQVAVIDEQIAAQAQRVFAETERQAEVARGEAGLARARVASLQGGLVPLVEANSEALRARIEYRILQQRAEAFTRLYEVFLTQFQEAEQLQLYPADQIRVLTPADVPRGPSSPSSRRVLALAVVLGLLVGAVHAALREWRETSLRTASDVTDGLGVRFLGYLSVPPAALRGREGADRAHRPKSKDGFKNRAIEYPLAHVTAAGSSYVETLRAVRSAVTSGADGTGARVVGVTSLGGHERRTTFAADLAGMISLTRGRILLLDGDPRTSVLSRTLGLTAEDDPFPASFAECADAVVGSTIAGSAVDVSGWSDGIGSRDPSEILSSAAMHAAIARSAKTYDCVVVDMPSLDLSVDARELLAAIEVVVVVARWGETQIEDLRHALLDQPTLGDRLGGVVLCDVDTKRLRRYTGSRAPRLAHRGRNSEDSTFY